ncbi:MAG: amidohydrolase family protein [Deltaproteobacteria bacterium]|nr:amidohydrolase family protein [Deltaproteobacteria bacterium]MBI4374087.1 amidohydrolase family protein [Deltaproteobacteria bacterium]
MLIAARWLLTGATPPLQNAAVLIEEGVIRDFGTRQWFAKRDVADVVDLGETILMPGLVNAHCHLEFSALKGKIPPTDSFTDWVLQLLMNNASLTPEEWKTGIKDGINGLIRGGTTTLADHRSPLLEPIETPFREFLFFEILGPGEERARESLKKGYERTAAFESELGAAQISPHSFYSVPVPMLEEILGPRAGETPLSIHLLENQEEEDFFRKGISPLAAQLKVAGGVGQFPDPSPVHWLKGHDWLGPHLMLVHGNHLIEEEIRLLRGTDVTVIHCPGSHRFFKNRRFPLETLLRHGVAVGIGTDSLASNESLNMLKQIKLMKESFPSLGGEDLLRMASLSGAVALGLGSEIGTVEVGKKADIVGVPLLNTEIDPYEALLLPNEIIFSMIEGRIILPLS